MRDGWTPEEIVGLAKRKRPSHGIKVVIEGVEFRTIKDACDHYGVDADAVRARTYNGYTIEDALLGLLNERGPRLFPKAFELNGENFLSGRDVEARFGIKWDLVRKRLKNGWSKEQALGLVEPPPRFRNFEGHARFIKWKNVRLSDENEIEPIPDANGYKLYVIKNKTNNKEYIGITVQSLEMRFRQHIDTALKSERKSHFVNAIRSYGADAFEIYLIRNDAKSFRELQEQEVEEIKLRNTIKEGYNSAHGGSLGTSKSIKIDGKIFPSRAQAAEYYGILIGVFNIRIGRLKWSPEEAVGLVERDWSGKSKSLTIDGNTFTSIRKLAAFYGMDFRKVYDRYSAKSWTIRQAVDLDPPPDTVKHRGEAIIYNGYSFASIAELGRHFDVNPDVIKRKLRKGNDLKDAIEDSIKRRKVKSK